MPKCQMPNAKNGSHPVRREDASVRASSSSRWLPTCTLNRPTAIIWLDSAQETETATTTIKPMAQQSHGGPHRRKLERYTVGWVCALPIELAAARTLLDEEHTSISLPDGDGGDDDTNSYYTLGRMGPHDVVIACLPAGTTAAAVA
ncbi:hypothetical protein B0T24DRAFT_627664 [Lasiosphaeria ovina]|uniref:Uncharacterized protein n=1 Tax=Lasiosphaeria ovina TaxID=92902 RepID=A0AAE0K6D5_9PEZI|nr:hypothetical protein B0T24DRAFT_627664 [Lasiosphaeria ovina]